MFSWRTSLGAIILLMHPGALKRRELSCVGQVCFETESKVSPMYIDLVLPLKGEKMSLDELRDLISQRMLPNNPRFTSRVQGTTFIPTDVDLEHHVGYWMYNFVSRLRFI